MDFRLYARVLWRFRLLVACGFLLATVLAALSIVRISGDGLAYRQTELFASTARVGVTQSGFPWGRLFAQEPTDRTTSRRISAFRSPTRTASTTSPCSTPSWR